MAGDSRYWVGILYPENMIEDWEIKIGDLLQLPYAYCIHDKDHLGTYKPKKGVDDDYDRIVERKKHLHCITAFSGPSTAKNAQRVFNTLSIPGKICCPLLPIAINNIRNKYEYLIHNTETAKKQGKFQYDRSSIVEGNGFDIGVYEQLDQAGKIAIIKEISIDIIREGYTNYKEFWKYALSNYDDSYFQIILSYKSTFAELCKGNYLEREDRKKQKNENKDEDLIDNEYTKAKGSME